MHSNTSSLDEYSKQIIDKKTDLELLLQDRINSREQTLEAALSFDLDKEVAFILQVVADTLQVKYAAFSYFSFVEGTPFDYTKFEDIGREQSVQDRKKNHIVDMRQIELDRTKSPDSPLQKKTIRDFKLQHTQFGEERFEVIYEKQSFESLDGPPIFLLRTGEHYVIYDNPIELERILDDPLHNKRYTYREFIDISKPVIAQNLGLVDPNKVTDELFWAQYYGDRFPVKVAGRIVGGVSLADYPHTQYKERISPEAVKAIQTIVNYISNCFSFASNANILKQKVETLEQTQARLVDAETRARVIPAFAGIGHDYGNVAQGLVGSFAPLETFLPELDLGEYKDIILEGIQGMKASLKQLDGIGKRIDGLVNQKELPYEMVSLNQLTDKVIDMLRPDLQSITARVDLKYDINLPLTYQSPAELEGVITNLLRNAIDHRAQERQLDLNISTGVEGTYIRYDVEDNGKGIPAPNKDKIFDPYFTSKIMQTSTGLGLSNVRTYIEKIGGRIEVESQVDAGSKFIIYIPIKVG